MLDIKEGANNEVRCELYKLDVKSPNTLGRKMIAMNKGAMYYEGMIQLLKRGAIFDF